MRTKLGTFRYPMEVGDATNTRFIEINPLVDTGALYSLMPSGFLQDLGHQPDAVRVFQLADGRRVELPIADVPVRLNGEVRRVQCVFSDADVEPLLGTTTLEAFSLAADPVNETLVPVVAMLLGMAPV